MIKKLRVTVDGKSYDVTVEMSDEDFALGLPHPAAPIAPTNAPAPAGTGDVTSPLAGKVASIDVQAGQEVAQGQQVLTLEAMKMNTYIYAPKAGRIAAVHVHPGDAVDEGARLMSIA